MTSIKNTQTVHLFDVDTDWTRLASGYADYVNNGNCDIYLQRQKKGTPEPTDKGVRIRPGGSFVTHPGEDEITYLKTLAGAGQVAKYQDLNQGAGTTAITDPESGNSVKINSSGQMLVVLDGRVDDDNSTQTPLLANAVFIGESVSTLDYAAIIISSYSDVASAVNGLCVQFSSDGVNDWYDGECYGCGADKRKTFSSQPERAFYRIKYTNGATNQAAFDLQCTLKKTMTKPSSHRIQDNIVEDDDAELVKAVITGERDDGVFTNARFDDSDRLKVINQEYTYAVAEGRVPNHMGLFKFGTRSTVAANTQSVVWEGPTALYPYLSAAEQLKVSSSSANDVAEGTGARTLTIYGLNDAFEEITETLTMTGLTPVTTANSYRRIYRAFVATCGTLYANAGNITIANNAANSTLVYIPAGDGQTLMTLWTVPLGHKAYITQIAASTNSNKGARVSVFTRYNDGGILYPWRIRYRAYLFSGDDVVRFNIPLDIPEKTDIEVRVITPTSSGDTSMGATFEAWYERV